MEQNVIEHESNASTPGDGKALAPRDVSASPLDLPAEQFRAGLDRRKENRAALMEWVRSALVEGVDYGRIHVVGKDKCRAGRNCTNPNHFSKPSLFKPGAEKICGMLGVTVHYPTLPDYERAALDGVQLHHVIIRCELHDAAGRVVADGVGARSLKQDYGDVNKSLKMGEKCLTGRTPVLIRTASGAVRTDIHRMSRYEGCLERGELQIAAPDGRWRRVVSIWKQAPSVVRQLVFQDGSEIGATPEHRWLMASGELRETKELRPGDVVARSRIGAGDGNADPEFGWLTGLFIADGTIDDARGVHFHLHAAESDIVERITRIATRLGAPVSDDPSGNKRTVSVWGKSVVGLVHHFVDGRGSYGKHLSRRAWRQGSEFLSALLDGYLVGDGGLTERHGRQPYWELGFTGRNRELADDLRALCTVLGYRCRLIKAEADDGTGKRHAIYRGWVKCNEPKYNGKDLATIVDIREAFQPTYDIEVDGDHLYCLANGLVTHNSAHIDATLRMAGLSEVFTQDVEDMTREQNMEETPANTARDPAQDRAAPPQDNATTTTATISDARRRGLEERINRLGLDRERVKAWVNKASQGRIVCFADLTPALCNKLEGKLETWAGSNNAA